jgi:hypothetical protein
VTKSIYSVPIVRKEFLHLWHEFWDKNIPTERAKKANEDASLGQTERVEAKNKEEAARLAEARNPGCVAIHDAINKEK